MQDNDTWTINERYYSKLDKGGLMFVFEQAEKNLAETNNIANYIVDRSTYLITLVTGLIIGIIAYIASNYSNIQPIYLSFLALYLHNDILALQY